MMRIGGETEEQRRERYRTEYTAHREAKQQARFEALQTSALSRGGPSLNTDLRWSKHESTESQ